MIRTIPLSKLVRSPRNVRRSSDEDADSRLAADIEARGLLQNLVATSVARPRGCFAVEAGDRRLRALQRLAEQGKLARTHEVCCLVLDGGPGAAREASLAENFQHLRMNPADECVAFQALIEQGSDVEGIARRFGLTTRFVEGRLRLAGLAPVVFEALGAGEISLDLAKAYAATPDQERQAYVFEQMSRGYGAAHPDSIRRMMTQATASAADRRARFVGEEAYVAAGGRVERDLFADDAATRWLDIALLERLACEKMDAIAEQVRAELGLGFVRPTLGGRVGYEQIEGLHAVTIESPPLTDEDSACVDALEAEIQTLSQDLDAEDKAEADREAGQARIRLLRERIDAILDRPPPLDDALKPSVGAFLLLDEDGRARLDPHYYAEAPLDGDRGNDASPDTVAPAASEVAPNKAAGLSQRLVDELAIQRRDILAVHVAADPGLALDLAIFLMIDGESGYRFEKSGSSLSASPPANPVLDFQTPDAPATLARAERVQALDRSWIEAETRAERFDAFRSLDEDSRAAWLGHAVARTLEVSLNLEGGRFCGFHDHLGRLLGIEVERWWRPTGANYFDRVPKSVALAALEEIGGAALAGRYANARKAELAQACERIFSGDFIAELEVKEAALAWLPAVMRFAPEAEEPSPAIEAEMEMPHQEPEASGEGQPLDIEPVEEAAEAA